MAISRRNPVIEQIKMVLRNIGAVRNGATPSLMGVQPLTEKSGKLGTGKIFRVPKIIIASTVIRGQDHLDAGRRNQGKINIIDPGVVDDYPYLTQENVLPQQAGCIAFNNFYYFGLVNGSVRRTIVIGNGYSESTTGRIAHYGALSPNNIEVYQNTT